MTEKDLDKTLGDYPDVDEWPELDEGRPMKERVRWEEKKDQIRENTGKWLALGCGLLTALMVFFIFFITSVEVIQGKEVKAKLFMEFFKMIFPALSSLLGVVFGFYFSNKRL